MTDNKLLYSAELTKIARICMENIHFYLADYDIDVIAYMKFNPKSRDLGKISLAGKKELALYKELGGTSDYVLSLVVNVAHTITGNEFLPMKMLWIVDHEFQRVTILENEQSFRIKMLSPDIEEFIPVIRRWQKYQAPLGGIAGVTLDQFQAQIQPIDVEQQAMEKYIEQAKPLTYKVIENAANAWNIFQTEDNSDQDGEM